MSTCRSSSSSRNSLEPPKIVSAAELLADVDPRTAPSSFAVRCLLTLSHNALSNRLSFQLQGVVRVDLDLHDSGEAIGAYRQPLGRGTTEATVESGAALRRRTLAAAVAFQVFEMTASAGKLLLQGVSFALKNPGFEGFRFFGSTAKL